VVAWVSAASAIQTRRRSTGSAESASRNGESLFAFLLLLAAFLLLSFVALLSLGGLLALGVVRFRDDFPIRRARGNRECWGSEESAEAEAEQNILHDQVLLCLM